VQPQNSRNEPDLELNGCAARELFSSARLTNRTCKHASVPLLSGRIYEPLVNSADMVYNREDTSHPRFGPWWSDAIGVELQSLAEGPIQDYLVDSDTHMAPPQGIVFSDGPEFSNRGIRSTIRSPKQPPRP